MLDGFLQLREVRPLVEEDKLSQSLQEGLCLHYDGGVILCFNRTFSGSEGYDQLLMTDGYRINDSYSLEFRPDIAIGYSGKWLLLDAKNKGESGFYGAEQDGLIGACKPEDLYKMHTYRDALVNVISAFVLYPGKQAKFYPARIGGACFAGVGALPLQPSLDGSMGIDNRLRLENLLRTFLLNA